ncbi:MAG: PAS domain-containing sensor histidine kinase, partial [Alphaproteobacteria bacterium]|nr:PAS domain-containing sensor histidine kinase [Alphaproteobacteria bacterium]
MVNTSREKLIGLNIKDFVDGFAYNAPAQILFKVSIKPRFCQETPAILIKSASSATSSMQPWIIYKSHSAPTSACTTKEVGSDDFMSQEVFTSASLPSIVATPRGEVVALNPAFATMVQDQVILEKNKIMQPGANVLDFIQAQGEPSFVSHLSAALLSSKISNPVEVKIANSEISAMAHISCIRHSRSSTKLLLIQLVDISSQKMLEQRFIQSQKMQAIGQLAGGISHDFNNLLTAMIGFCDLLLQRYTTSDPSYGDVVQIKQNAGRAANLVRQLLAFSRQQTLKPSVISITDVLVGLSSLLKRLAGVNVDFRVVHGKDPYLIKADNGQLEQVIINLVVNARDAMPNGGQLVITTRNCFVEKEFKCVYDVIHPGDYLMIEVADTGCGIDSAVIGSIFEPFFSRKDDKTRKSSGSGTGLGLSTVYGIINQSGGFIHVDSKVGKGSIFR